MRNHKLTAAGTRIAIIVTLLLVNTMFARAQATYYDSIHRIEDEMMEHIANVNKVWDLPDTTGVSAMNNAQILQLILPQAIAYSKSDSTQIFYNNVMQLHYPIFTNYQESSGDTSVFCRHVFMEDWDATEALIVGKFIYGNEVFAISANSEDSLFTFYRLDIDHWKEVGRESQNWGLNCGEFFFEEMNNKPALEIVLSTWPPNMNGNRWMELFVYKPEADSVSYAGSFCTSYTVNLADTTMSEVYGGSWYMDQHQTFYVWHNDYLTPVRQSIMVVSKDWDKPGHSTLEYYEDPGLKLPGGTPQGLKRIFRERYNDRNPKHIKYWDNF